MPTWLFEKWSPMGSMPASGLRKQLAGIGLPKEELLVREITQNSTDAEDKANNNPVKLRISLNKFEGESYSKLLNDIKIEEKSTIFERIKRDSFRPFEKNDLDVMLIEDFNTVGLTGRDRAGFEDDAFDRYVKLCLNFGDTDQSESVHRGGSFGFGKSVYWVNSDFWIVIFYSRFAQSERSGECTRRLIGVGWFNDYQEGGRRHTGRAWLCNRQIDEGTNEEIPVPLIDEEADLYASRLDIPIRKSLEENGTSIMIFGSKITSMDKLRAGLELYWWPRIISKKLEVELYQDGQALLPLFPRDNTSLSQHIRCWDLLFSKDYPNEHERICPPLVFRSSDLGKLSLTVHQNEHDSFDDEEHMTNNSIALIRYPGMVVKYFKSKYRISRLSYSGVFKADDSIDPILKESEPLSHDRWDKTSNRIQDDEFKQIIVDKTHERIRKNLREFLKSKQPPPPTAPNSCSALGSKLADLFKGHSITKDEPLSPGERRKFSFRYLKSPVQGVTNDGIPFIEAEFKIGPNNDMLGLGETTEILIKPKLVAYMDECFPSGEKIDVSIIDKNEKWDSEACANIVGGAPGSRFKLMACPIPADDFNWRITLEFLVI